MKHTHTRAHNQQRTQHTHHTIIPPSLHSHQQPHVTRQYDPTTFLSKSGCMVSSFKTRMHGLSHWSTPSLHATNDKATHSSRNTIRYPTAQQYFIMNGTLRHVKHIQNEPTRAYTIPYRSTRETKCVLSLSKLGGMKS